MAALFSSCSGGDDARSPERPNVLWITVDTLRADHLGCYGYELPTSPAIDGLAAEGLLFSHAQAPRAKTTPSLASLFTGLYPHEHGVRHLLEPLETTVPVFTERLQEAGYRTGAVVGNMVLRRELAGLHRGFDQWTEALPDRIVVPPDSAPQRTARSLTDAALVALGLSAPPPESELAEPFEPRGSFVEPEAPWFLWLHYMDPHGTYDAPVEHDVFAGGPPEPIEVSEPLRGALHRPRIAEYNVPSDARGPDGTIDAARVRAYYDAEIRFVDTELSRLIAELKQADLWESTLVIFTSDHGESLGEHEYWFEHGVYAYEATCRIPLIVKLPGNGPTGTRKSDVALADVAPTLLDWLGLDALAPDGGGVRGRSRVDLLTGDTKGAHPVYSEKVEAAGMLRTIQIKAVRVGDWKLVRRYALLEGPDGAAQLTLLREELYDLANDPAEARNLAGNPPAQAPLDILREALPRFVREDPYFRDLDSLLRRGEDEMDEETRSALRALGYLGN